jgi:hypothetical protein
MIALGESQEAVDPNCGRWRKPWSSVVQSHWLEAMYKIALSKPFVESVTWHDLVDHQEMELPLSGLIGADMVPKSAFRRLVNFRRNLMGAGPAVTMTESAEETANERETSVATSAAITPAVTPTPEPRTETASVSPFKVEQDDQGMAEASDDPPDDESATEKS